MSFRASRSSTASERASQRYALASSCPGVPSIFMAPGCRIRSRARLRSLERALLPRRALEGSVDVDEMKRAHFVERSSSVAIGASWCAALPPVHRRRRVVNQTSDELQVGGPAAGPAELPQLTSRPVVPVESRVHLFSVTIGAVTIQGDANMRDEFTQTRLVVPSNTFLRVAACAAHAATVSHVRETGPQPPDVALVLLELMHPWEAADWSDVESALDQARFEFGDLTFTKSNVRH